MSWLGFRLNFVKSNSHLFNIVWRLFTGRNFNIFLRQRVFLIFVFWFIANKEVRFFFLFLLVFCGVFIFFVINNFFLRRFQYGFPLSFRMIIFWFFFTKAPSSHCQSDSIYTSQNIKACIRPEISYYSHLNYENIDQ